MNTKEFIPTVAADLVPFLLGDSEVIGPTLK